MKHVSRFEIDLSRWSMPKIQARVSEDFLRCALRVDVAMQVKNVETGELGPVIASQGAELELIYDEALMKKFIYHAIRSAVLHELDECLYIDGERLCADPHPELKAHAAGPNREVKAAATQALRVYGRSLAQVNQE